MKVVGKVARELPASARRSEMAYRSLLDGLAELGSVLDERDDIDFAQPTGERTSPCGLRGDRLRDREAACMLLEALDAEKLLTQRRVAVPG